MDKTKKCKYCNSDINIRAKKCKYCKKNLGINPWLVAIPIVITFILMIFIIGSSDVNTSNNIGTSNNIITSNNITDTKTTTQKNNKVEVKVIDFSLMTKDSVNSWATENKITCKITEEYSNSVGKGLFIKQSIEKDKTIYEGDTITITYSLGKEPSIEYKNALKKAETYSEIMNMSKQGIYDQLTSEYGEKFPADAAQYAIDNIQANWNANALAKAKTYQTSLSMSKSAIYDQLISEYGEKFTTSEAQYAVNHLND